MKWFKHYSMASMQTPVRSINEQYGYYGLGVFWCIMETVCLHEGCISVGEIERMFCSKRFSKANVKDLLLGYGLFKVSARSLVSLADDIPTVKRSDKSADIPAVIPTDIPTDVPADGTSNARAYNKTREDKNREEEVKETSSAPPSASSVVIEDPDAASVRKAAGERMICDIFYDLYEAKSRFPEWYEQMCMKFGHEGMLEGHWPMAIDMFKSHIICRGKWNDYVQTRHLLRMAACYLTDWENTHQEVVDEILNQKVEVRKSKACVDFMSTYCGPPVPDDAPPRPSHTAVYDFGDDVWFEPREVKGFSNHDF